jgi:hypothetical protein
VRDALSRDAVAVFRSATKAASARADDVASALRVQIAGVEVQKDIVIAVRSVVEKRNPALDTMVTHIVLEWEAAKSPRLFPLMRGELKVYALTATETQLVIDAVLGKKIAEASVHRFSSDVAAYLRRSLAAQ